MKTLKIMSLAIWYVATALIGCLVGMFIADDVAYRGAIDEEYLELYECAIEQDYDCDIEYYDYHNAEKGEVTYFCVSNYDESHYFFVRLELKKVAPFRYEWIEVDL